MIIFSCSAWYDYELTAYQQDRQDCELERVFEERHSTAQTEINVDHLKQKVVKEPEPEWTKNVKMKKSEDYYSKLKEVRINFSISCEEIAWIPSIL